MRGVLLVALSLGAMAAVAAADEARVRSVTLRNGLQVLILPDPLATAVDVAVWYRAGVRMEPARQTGMSALVGRLMFRGSKNFPPGEHQRLIEAEGGSFNTVINPDYSCFYQTLPCEAADVALRLEADRMGSLVITPEGFEAERRMVQEQRRRTDGAPMSRALQQLYATSFGAHPYGRPANGMEDDLERLTLADVEAYRREYYTPDNAVLTVVGCVDYEPTLAAIRRYFEAIPKRAKPAVPPAATIEPGERRGRGNPPTPSPMLLVGWRGPGAADPDGAAFDVLSRIVVSGPSSRLQRLERARSQNYLLIQGDSDRSREAGLLFCLAVVRGDADTVAAETTLVADVQKLATVPVSDAELERAKRQIESATVFGSQTVRGRASQLGIAQLLEGDYRAADRWRQRFESLTAADVKRVAAKTLQSKNRSTVWIPAASLGRSGLRRGRP